LEPSTRIYPPEADDIIKDAGVLGISAEDQLKLRELLIETITYREILANKHQHINMQAKGR
jgi:hypothetical protein